MKTPTVRYYCCCVKLRTGGLIMGWLALIIASISIIFSAIMLKTIEEDIENVSPDQSSLDQLLPFFLIGAGMFILNKFSIQYSFNEETIRKIIIKF